METGSEMEGSAEPRSQRRHVRRLILALLLVCGCMFVAFKEIVWSPRVRVEGAIETKVRSVQQRTLPENKDDADNTSPPAEEEESPVSDEDAEKARAFVMARRAAYQGADRGYAWKLRGVGYLYMRHKLILLAQLPKDPQVGTRQQVVIRNVSEKTATDCDKLAIWVRVMGPEIFAGAAEAVMEADVCYWQFNFDLAISGTYDVDVKVLEWNGEAKIDGTKQSQCDVEQGPPPPEEIKHLKHDGFQGFKMYFPAKMCCEACARTPFCVYWSTPFLRIPNPSTVVNGCELYFFDDAPDDAMPKSSLWPQRRRRRLTVESFHGKVHDNPTSYFCGCGWSWWFTLDFRCLDGDLDDRVFSVESSFHAIPSSSVTKFVEPQRFCTLQDEQQGRASRGRWVRESYPDDATCPSPVAQVALKTKDFPMTAFDPLHPHCWHREDLSQIGNKCIEMNCRLMDKTTSRWISSLHMERKFFGVWRPYFCNYMEFTTDQLQECITKRKITRFTSLGASVAVYLREFVDHRLENITLYPDDKDPESMTIIYDTLSMLHRSGPDGEFEEYLRQQPSVPDNQEHYWFTGYFLSSEREVHTHVVRIDKYNRELPDILEPKNYKMINTFDLTSAFTYDAATQMDGMHLVGPPAKMIVTKLFHHICSGVVEGSPV